MSMFRRFELWLWLAKQVRMTRAQERAHNVDSASLSLLFICCWYCYCCTVLRGELQVTCLFVCMVYARFCFCFSRSSSTLSLLPQGNYRVHQISVFIAHLMNEFYVFSLYFSYYFLCYFNVHSPKFPSVECLSLRFFHIHLFLYYLMLL